MRFTATRATAHLKTSPRKPKVARRRLLPRAAWADYDRDGNVDLFVSRYVTSTWTISPNSAATKFCKFQGCSRAVRPWGMQGETDFLYHNRGDGTFEEVSKKAGVYDPDGYYGLGVTWGDYDNDGWPDLFVADDSDAQPPLPQ